VLYPGPQPSGDSKVAVAYGWLRASHRKLDAARSTPHRPYHTHDEVQKLRPGEPVAVEIEILPTSAVFERGHRLVVEVGAVDDPHFGFQHDDPRDRVRAGEVTVHTGGAFDSHLLLPVIPALDG
jgi:predicted acyl esterase